jgi:anti-sigma B factor antagonist
MDTPLAVVEYDRAGRHLTAYLAGELDQTSCPPLAGDLLRHIHPDDEVVWLDLSAVTFCASAGVAMFVQLHRHIRPNGGRLTLYHPSPNVQRVLDMCGLADVLSIWPDPERRGVRQSV